MKKGSGVIYKTDRNQFAVAKHSEQQEKIYSSDKVIVRIYSDRMCNDPVYDKPVLKSVSKLTMIGFVD